MSRFNAARQRPKSYLINACCLLRVYFFTAGRLHWRGRPAAAAAAAAAPAKVANVATKMEYVPGIIGPIPPCIANLARGGVQHWSTTVGLAWLGCPGCMLRSAAPTGSVTACIGFAASIYSMVCIVVQCSLASFPVPGMHTENLIDATHKAAPWMCHESKWYPVVFSIWHCTICLASSCMSGFVGVACEKCFSPLQGLVLG